jgi:hydroxymethylpyrimidine pyrophosphatase-like HAD family hydrolase
VSAVGPAIGDLAHIRLVATDLDGTLLRSDGTISCRTAEALDGLEAAGIALVLITARPPRWMGPIAAMTGHHGLAVCANGAVTYDLHASRVVHSSPLPADAALEVVRRLRLAVPGGTFAVESAQGFSCEPGHLQHQWDEESNPPVADVARLLEMPALKLLFGHPDWTADDLLAVARELVGDIAEPTHSNPERAAIELSALGVSKATTLARLCAARGISAADVLAFGDMPNDLPMLTWAGTAVAVANAHPEVLAAVSFVTAGNDEDGVAIVIERLPGSAQARPAGSTRAG